MSEPRLEELQCRPLPAGTPALTPAQIAALLAQLPGWAWVEGALRKTFSFSGYGQTVGFVNAVAWIADRQDHHPELSFGYNRCVVAYNTHSIGGISMNDFICAARIEALF